MRNIYEQLVVFGLIFRGFGILTVGRWFLVVRIFPHIFVSYFYRGEVTAFFYCHFCQWVVVGLRWLTMVVSLSPELRESWHRSVCCHGLTIVVDGWLRWSTLFWMY